MALIAGMALAAGAEAQMPDWDQLRADFDAQLVAEPRQFTAENTDELTLLQALGLR